MTLSTETVSLFLPLIAALAFGLLFCRLPSLSGIILFIESLLISIVLGTHYGLASDSTGIAILLSFFALTIVGTNLFFESSFKTSLLKTPKLNILAGILLLLIFAWNILPLLADEKIAHAQEGMHMDKNTFNIIIAAFSMFSILVASTIIFELRHHDAGDET